jgi:hypothetical protein
MTHFGIGHFESIASHALIDSPAIHPFFECTNLSQMPGKSLLTFLVLSMALCNSLNRISQYQLIVCSGKDCGWNVYKDCNGGVTVEGVAAKKIAATIRVPRSRARLVEMVTLAKPQIILAYARPITNGVVEAAIKGLAGSRTAQITRSYIALASVLGTCDMRI